MPKLLTKTDMHIGIAGNIGSGKTSLTRMLAQYYGWTPKFEAVSYNPYLEDYYKDIQRWSFNLEVYFLTQRFKDLLTDQPCNDTSTGSAAAADIDALCGRLPESMIKEGQEHSGLCVDLPSINKFLLCRCGVPADNIFVSDLCTSCRSDILFSHRASCGRRGLMASMIYKRFSLRRRL